MANDTIKGIFTDTAWETGLIKNPRVRTAFAALATAKAATDAVQRLKNYAENRLAYSVSVAGDDPIFLPIHEWLLNHISQGRLRTITIRTINTQAERPRRPARLLKAYNGDRAQILKLDGHRVQVTITREDTKPSRNEDRDVWLARRERITFTSYSAAGHRAVESLIQRLANAHYETDRPPAFHMPDRWGNEFRRRSDVPPRTLDTIVLPEGVLDSLVSDVESFLAAESAWAAIGQPWHRGYLFYGPPGTGKTSIGRALANYFGFDVYYISLSNKQMTDADFMSLVAQVPPRSVLLLEDVDVFHAATERSDESSGVTLSGLLNSLDGINTPHGLITIMTTNDRDVLDEALVRPGRVDFEIEVTYATLDQVERLAQVVWGQNDGELFNNFFDRSEADMTATKLSPAEIVEVFKRNLTNPIDAAVALESLIKNR